MFGRERGKAVLRAEAAMPGRRGVQAWGCACCAMAALPATPAVALPPATQRHLGIARQAAGDDLGPYLRLGDIASAPPAAPRVDLVPLTNQPGPPPDRAFENLHFVAAAGSAPG